MRKKIVYLSIATLLVAAVVSVSFLKRQKATNSKNNSESVMLAFTDKVASLSDSKNQDYLQENLTLGDIAKVTDEFERILIGKKLSLESLKNDDTLYQQWQTLTLVTDKLEDQLAVNSFFLASDYRDVTSQGATSKEYAEITKTKELLESTDHSTVSSTEEKEQSKTEKDKQQLKNFAQLVAINGDKVNPYLIVQDDLTEKEIQPLVTQLSQKKPKDNWDKSILTLIKNAQTQLATIKEADTLVNELFTEDEQVMTGIATPQYTTALEAVEKIYNQTHQQRLMDKMILVAQGIGQELESKVYSYDALANKTDIIFTATQGNDKWWEGPLTFSVDVKNNSTKKISFNHSQLVIETKEMTFFYSQYSANDGTDTFVVEPGESFKINDLTFNVANEETANDMGGSYLSYLVKDTLEATSNSQTIKGVTLATKEKETTLTTTTTSETTEVASATVTEAQLKKARKFLANYGIDESYLTDGDLELLIIQSLSEQLKDEDFLRLVCDSLKIDYDQLIAEHSDSQ